MTTGPDILQLLFDFGSVVDAWVPIMLSTLALVTAAVIVNPIAIVGLGYKLTIKATNFGFGLVRKLIGILK